MIRVKYKVYIGGTPKNYAWEMITVENLSIAKEQLKEVIQVEQKLIQTKIDKGLWREQNSAGEFEVSLELYSMELTEDELEALTKEVNF